MLPAMATLSSRSLLPLLLASVALGACTIRIGSDTGGDDDPSSQIYGSQGGSSSVAGAGGSAQAGQAQAGQAGQAQAGQAGQAQAGQAGQAQGGATQGGTASLRFAHLSIPASGSAFEADVCYRPCTDVSCLAGSFSDGNVVGPIFANARAAAKLPADTEFYYPGISTFVDIPTGTYEFRLVKGGATDCSTGYGPGWNDQPRQLVESYATMIFGGSEAGVTATLSNEPDFTDATKVGYRAYNHTKSGPLEFGLLSSQGFLSLLPSVGTTVGQASTDSVGSWSPAFVVPEASPVAVVTKAPARDTKAGDSYTVFAFGTTVTDAKPELRPGTAFCIDSDLSVASGTGLIANGCTYGN